MVEAGEVRRASRPGRGRIDGAAVGVLVVASALAGAFSGVHPTGTPAVDPIYTALFAGLVTAAAGTAGRVAVLWLAAVAAGFSRGYVIFPALAALAGGFAGALLRRPNRVLNAASGAVAVQVALRLPHVGVQGGSAVVAGVAVAPCLVHAVTFLPRRARRAVVWAASGCVALAVVVSIPVGVEALLSHNRAAVGTTAAEDALRSVSDGNSAGGKAQLQAAEADFASVANRLGAWWTAGARLVPVVAQQREAALTGAEVARDVSAAAGAEAGRIDFASLHFHGSGVDLAQVAQLRAPLDRVDAVLTRGLARLRAARSGWLVQPLASRLALVTEKVGKAQHSASLADEAVAAAPSLLGGDGVRHYMVIVMDPAESRGLGGLIVSYGIVTASNGHLSLQQFQDISKLNARVQAHGPFKLTAPADFVARYGQNPAVYAQNVTYSPDLPTVTDVLNQLYHHAYGGTLDGVLVVDPKSIASLLGISGGVQVAGIGEMTSANAQQILDQGQYVAYPSPSQQTERRAALTAAMKQVLGRLTSMPLPGPHAMADMLDPDVRSGDLLFWSVHPSAQPLLESTGLSGSFPRANGQDLLGVVTANAANNKIDTYLQRTVSDHVTYDPSNGHVTATVQVVLHNEAPATGLSTEVIGSYSGSGLPPGTNEVWLTLYSPLRMLDAAVDGKNLATATTAELGVEAYSGYIDVPAGGTRTLTVRLDGRVRAGGYGLHLYSQPTVLPTRTSVTVSDSGSQETWTPSGASRNFRYFANR